MQIKVQHFMATRGSYVHNSMVIFLVSLFFEGGHPQKC